ncbi:MAG TPA: AI-2E family transporter, partial [candidate division Zixibacteria bacterium]|nr:AI-2E family transporter [candidate division Zixibacteria bacterium]
LFYQMSIAFFVPICWAAVFVITFYPLYQKLLKKIKSKGLVAALMCLLIVILLVGPFAYIFAVLVNEAAMAVAKVNALHESGQLDEFLSFNVPWINTLKQILSQYFDVSQFDLNNLVKQLTDNVSSFLFSQTGWLISNGTRLVFYFGLMIFTMYYFFKDGEALIKQIKTLVPLSNPQVNRIYRQLRDVIYATMYGGLVVALLQGLLGGIMFAIFGISSPVFWGGVMAVLSIIPFIGAFIIYIPAGMILIFSGSYVQGILVIVIGTVVVSQVDNVLRPLLVSGKTEMHPLLLFFSMLGGVAMFGLLGVVLGPIIAAVFVSLLKILELRLQEGDEAAE